MFKSLTKLAVASALVAGAASSAQAHVFMRIADLAPDLVTLQASVQCNTSLAQNNVAGGNCSTVDGFFGYALNATGIGFSGTIGNFSVFTTSGTSNIPGSANVAFLDTSSTSVRNLNANLSGSGGPSGFDNLYIDFRGFNFLFPDNGAKSLFGTASYSRTVAGGGLSETLDSNFYADPTNAGGVAVADNCDLTLSSNGSCNSGDPLVWFDTPGTSFSLRSQQFFGLNGGSTVNATTSVRVNPAPEPMTLSLVAVALMGAAVAARRAGKKA